MKQQIVNWSIAIGTFTVVIGFIAVLGFAVVGSIVDKRAAHAPTIDGDKVTEQVREVWYRTELRHAGCPKDGYWRIDTEKQARRVEVYDKGGYMYPHKCSGCGTECEIFNVRYPLIKREWEAVK